MINNRSIFYARTIYYHTIMGKTGENKNRPVSLKQRAVLK